ncbi:MAG: hypothetical protein ACM65K_06730 [Microcoleus sp.]
MDYYAQIWDRAVAAVAPNYTSQDCSNCGMRGLRFGFYGFKTLARKTLSLGFKMGWRRHKFWPVFRKCHRG